MSEASHQRGLDRLKGLLAKHRETCSEMDEHRERFNRIKGAEPTRAVSSFNLFQTPQSVADLMVTRLGVCLDGLDVLEPSAGLGRLYQAVRRQSIKARLTLVEIAPQCAGELYQATQGDEAATLFQRDFLTWSPGRLFDVVIMNPPFKNGVDLKHIAKAYDLLKPGGVLVSLCASGPRQRAKYGDQWEELPPKSFHESGTDAGVCLVRLVR